MATFTNQNKNVSSFTLQNRGRQGMTWDEATFTWDEAQGTWDDPRDTFSLLVKSPATFTLQTKL